MFQTLAEKADYFKDMFLTLWVCLAFFVFKPHLTQLSDMCCFW